MKSGIRLATGTIFAILLNAVICHRRTTADAGVQEYASALVQYFNSLRGGYEPFIVSEGQQVGDLIDVKTRSVLKRRAACFPNLVPPQPQKFDLPRFVGMSQTAASFLFEIKKWIGLTANDKIVDNVSLVFSDATIEDVTLDDLQSKLSKDCDFLKPLIMDGQVITVFGRTATLVRTIVRARTNTVVSFGVEADAGAKVEQLQKLLPGGTASVLPIDASIEAKIDLKGQKAVTLQADGPSAVAFRPTHIPRKLLGGEPADGLIPFDPTNNVQIEIQERASNAWLKDLK